MLTAQTKWWRWIGEESLSGGIIGAHEGGGTYPCGQRRPSEHSQMRWIGFDLDQIGLEHMVARVTGMRNSGQMNVQNTPTAGTVAKDAVLWLETGHPRFHAGQRDLADRRSDRPGDRHRPAQPRPRAAEPRSGHRGVGRGPRPGRAERHRLGAQPVDEQRLHGLRLQRAALRADAHVDGRRHDRDAVGARRRTSRSTRRTRTRSRPTRSSTSRPTTRLTGSSRSRGPSTGSTSRTRPTAATWTSAP